MVDTTKTILFKKEATYGTDAAPVVGTDAALTRNFQTEPLVVDALERNLDKPTRGGSPVANTNRRTTCSFEVELQSSGAAGTAAPWMRMLECCAMAAPVLTAGVRAEQRFAPLGAALSSGTIHDWHANQRRRKTGCRGDFSLDFTAGQYPFAALNFIGIPHATPVDANAPGAPNYAAWLEPLEVNTANTDFTLDTYPLVLKQLRMDINGNVRPRNLVGANYIQRGNHAISGTIVGEAPDLAAKNYFTTLDSGSQVAMQLIHGTVAGRIVQLDAGFLQITKITLAEEDEVLMVNISYRLNISVGQDDLLITAK
jgi:hypothetical protein